MERSTRLLLFALMAAPVASGCGPDFTPYNEVIPLRVLALGADRPWVPPGGRTEVRPLIVADGPVEHTWSWCPLTTGPADGYRCALTRDEVQAAVDEALGPGLVEVPSFELGTSSTAVFRYDLPPQLFRGVCDELLQRDLPEFVELPDCTGGFPVTVRLDASSGDDEIAAIKEIRLLFEADAPTNQNPQLVGAFAVSPDGRSLVLPETETSTTFERKAEYELYLTVSSTAAEPFLAVPPEGGEPREVQEDLVVTWFIDSGETDRTRRSVLAGTVPFEPDGEPFQFDLGKWTTPGVPDFPDETSTMYFVIRDERGGVSWMRRQVRLGGAE